MIHHGRVELGLPDMVGLHHLADLVTSPGRDIPAIVLAGGRRTPAHPRRDGHQLRIPPGWSGKVIA